MTDNVANYHQLVSLAQDVLTLARNTLLVNLRFLDLALSQFRYKDYPSTLSTDGNILFFDPYYVLSAYKVDKAQSVRDYLHMVLHCVFRHLFGADQMDRRCWDLACDIAVESAINDLDLSCAACRRQERQQEILADLERQVHPLTAEKLYRHFLDQNLRPDEIAALREPFMADDHRPWYLGTQGGEQGGGGESGGTTPTLPNARPGKSPKTGGSPRRDNPRSASERKKQLEANWKEISERLQVDLDTLSAQRAAHARGLVQELRTVNRERYDYADFLRRYMTLGEEMQVNDDEFDYIFYTYGLDLYGNMPLVEPLEYKELRRVKELVIAIDTSGSVSGELVQRFVTKTYNILRQQENFFTKMVYFLFVFSMVVPFQMLMFTLAATSDQLKLNTPWNIWVIYLGFGAGLAVFMFTGFMKSIPLEIEEAAMIDGCNPLQTFFMIVLPVLKPTMISVGILETMWVWNDYLLPYLVLDRKKYTTVPILIQYFKGSFGRVEMGPMMACIMLTVLPIIIVYLVCQKYIIDGVVAGAVKG